jgi:monofunctional biosynthetic peptidoglycan transglycosylase
MIEPLSDPIPGALEPPIEAVPETAPALLPAVPVEATPARPRWRWIRAGLLLAAAWLVWEAVTWPHVAGLAKQHPASTAFIDDYRGLGWFRENRPIQWKWVSYSRISGNLKQAVLVGEDIGFFGHQGFESQEMRNALEEAWEERRLPRGASTVTQQLAKNLWLSPSRNPLRKVKEAALTWQLERQLSKRRILELYLNVVELGPGIYGAEAASRHYFGHSAAGLSAHEAAQLAASLPNPKKWNPKSGGRGYRWRVRLIERRMAQSRWLRRRV